MDEIDEDILWLLLLDSLDEPFMVPNVMVQFPPVDAAQRLPIEGTEEDGQFHNPASRMRRQLVADMRTQARQAAITAAGSTATVEASRASGIIAANDAFRAGGSPASVEAARVTASASVIGDKIIRPVVAPPLSGASVDLFNRLSGAKIDGPALSRLMEVATQSEADKFIVGDSVADVLASPAFSSSRAATVVRTETAKAFMERKLLSFGRDKKKQWVVSPDACPFCQELEGTVLPLFVPFNTRAYFGNVLTPPAHPNCRCSIIEI